ncbi:hypothetical protein QF042_002920 [Pedobacter sp. W3I1]|nr:hypothetical protein [Pedobacter sp. W3I1]
MWNKYIFEEVYYNRHNIMDNILHHADKIIYQNASVSP